MGAAFGMDLGAVRVHTDRSSDAFNRTLSAEASTIGNDIYFREGAYRPGTPRGRRLLAHELTHVAQQGGLRGSSLSIGAPHTGAEQEAEAVGERVAAGETVDPGAVTPVAAGVVQRRYLDANPSKEGYRLWTADTSFEKRGATVGRAKLQRVDTLLRRLLKTEGPPNWEYLSGLRTALQGLKYTDPTKTKPTFSRRRAAVQILLREVQARLATPVSFPPMVVPPAYGHPASPEVTRLMAVGFTRAFLDGLSDADLALLYEADDALTLRDLPYAQKLLDELNPPVVYAPDETRPTFPGWAPEQSPSIHLTTAGAILDVKRHRSELMAAQRQLIAFHAEDIGGDYATMMRYKPYKANPLSQAEIEQGTRYFNKKEIRDWQMNVLKPGANSIGVAIGRTQGIAAASTAVSIAKGKYKYTMADQKDALTDDEVKAIRIYTADEYREMNAVFRDFRVDQPTANWAKYSAIAKLAISGMGKLPKARNVVSYRGDNDVNFGGHTGVLRKGATFRLPNFYSTTADPGKAFPGAVGYVFHNDRWGRLIEDFSALQGEREVLLPPGARYRITEQFEKQLPGNTWLSADGTAGLTGDVAAFAQQEPATKLADRKVYLEFREV